MTLWLRWLALACFLTALFQAEPARACIKVTAYDGEFGSHNSFVVREQALTTSSSSMGMKCDSPVLGILAQEKIEVTITSKTNPGSSFKAKSPAGDEIGYQLFAGPNQTYPWTSGVPRNYTSSNLINLLGIVIGGGGVEFPLYLRTVVGSNIPAGTYEDTLNVKWDWHYCPVIAIDSLCVKLIGLSLVDQTKSSTDNTTLKVRLTVTNDCAFGAATLPFGSAPTPATFAPATVNLSITCTRGITYTVGLGPGNNPAGGVASGRRQMVKGGDLLQYDLYKSNNEIWRSADNRSDPVASTGDTAQTFSVIGKIYPDQPASTPVGTYTDSVLVDVKY